MTTLRLMLLAGIPAGLWGQAMVEYGLGVAAAGTIGAPGQAAGKSIGGIFSNLQKTMNASTEAATAPPAAAPAAKPQPRTAGNRRRARRQLPPEPPKPAVVYDDPARITAGMERAEVIGRFGEPAMSITAARGSESMTYQTAERRIDVEMRDGKVFSVQNKEKPKQNAVVILQ